jgi:hypothetical protein
VGGKKFNAGDLGVDGASTNKDGFCIKEGHEDVN